MAVRDHNGRSGTVEHAEDLRERSTGELVGHLAQETGQLVRQELRYAKAEMKVKLERSRSGALMLGAAAITGVLALGALTATLIAALDEAMPTWLAALIVTLVWSAVAAVAAVRGRELLRRAGAPVPENSIHEMKEDVEWLRQRTRS